MARQRLTRLIMGPCIICQYQFEVSPCRNEEFIVKGNFWWAWSLWASAPQIDRIVIRDVQYQFEVKRCRNEEVIVKGNFGWAWSMLAGIDRIVIRDVQYQFEVNRCRNEEVIVKGNFGWAWFMRVGRPRRIVIRDVQYQLPFLIDGRTDRRTDRQTEITTISPRFSKSVGITRAMIYMIKGDDE
ncbi:hypothetical protein DPMN_051125 [Dreissena polymorpha]|uniref:Uncharacterized protein n=1 Tax=Dreissena polymorpha TaxID=45954 RepID=A0A9D4HNM3_DREPO|nr:hypothetical protein DPMN_051125 [Dreissena polymorpha]